MTTERAYETKTIEYLGLVSGMVDELGISALIDESAPQDFEQRKGTAVKAMVLNGLGFASCRLSLTPHFYRNKPTERLLGAGITPVLLNDGTLGRALDSVHAFGVTELFTLISSQATAISSAAYLAPMGHAANVWWEEHDQGQEAWSHKGQSVFR